ncbi:hypothetical protein J2792_002311 [Novosphingobium capsulatum]|uniref:HNH endonuclease n=1 Tax=Novosphingobium capsulatum TaxID=13688 RepID=A0ABU1MM80_9SPHN|nr:NUMOD4 domain-containing protein [Novosphingobium capsulatum]MDR6511439.1 hypothetical protein [Novosphingobium capsulatum]
MIKEEIWKPIIGFEGVYEISDSGNVRALDRVMQSGRWGHVSRKGGPIKAKIDQNGRPCVGLRINGKRIYKHISILVCEAFHGPRPSLRHQVAHFPDPDPKNNVPNNLRWATSLENHNDRRIHGTTPVGEKNCFAILNESEVRKIRELYRPGRPYHPGNHKEIAKHFNICPGHVQAIASRRAWGHVA